MSKQAITLLQTERDAVLECLRDMGGRATDEQSSTVAEYDEAIEAIQKLMDSQADDLKAYALLFKENAKLRARVEHLEEAVIAFIEYDDNTDEDGISMMERYAVAIALARSAQIKEAA